MQNLVVFIEPSEDDSNISAKAAMLFLNRFCIGEESACELSGVYYLKSEEPLNFTLKQKVKGKGKAIFESVLATEKIKSVSFHHWKSPYLTLPSDSALPT